MTMDYDQERTYFKGQCIEYDVIDMFQMMVDIALEPRSVLAANVARSKNAKSGQMASNHIQSRGSNRVRSNQMASNSIQLSLKLKRA